MPSSTSTRSTGSLVAKNSPRSDEAARSDEEHAESPSGGFCCCCTSAAVVESVVEFATVQANSLRAAPPLMLMPGYANEAGEARGTAPPMHGVFEVVNKTKYPAEIIGVLVSPIAAQLALKRQRDVLGHLEYLRHGCMPSQTVMHATFADVRPPSRGRVSLSRPFVG